MIEPSEILLHLFNGGTCNRPPFWEPWFAMERNLRERYGDDRIAMALDLGHAAVALPWVDMGVSLATPVERIAESGVWYGGGSLRTIAQLRELPEPDWANALARLSPLREECRQRGVACWLVLPWCFHSVATSMGLEHFAMACYDEPEVVHEAMAFVEARNAAAIERLVSVVRPDFVLFDGDCAYKTSTMIAPDMMRRFVTDPTRPNVRALRQLGAVPVFHTDGKLDDVVPMLTDLGFAAVHGCESAANDLGHLVEQFGRQIVLCGNMDVVFLTQSNPPQIQHAAHKMLRTGNRYGRFVAGCNTSPLDYIPWENYRAFTEAVRRWNATPAA
jgi:hypothetical protein